MVRASISEESQANTRVLVDICESGRRQDASVAVNGVGLCMAGAAYDLLDLRLNKHKAKSMRANKAKHDDNNNSNKISVGNQRAKRKAVQHGLFVEEEEDDDDDEEEEKKNL